MKFKTIFLLPFLVAVGTFFAGCSTPVAIDPVNQPESALNARYQAGFFYGPVSGAPREVFLTSIRELDSMGYLRTGELHEDAHITIFARKVGDERVVLRIMQTAPGESEIRIRVGRLGNLSESQIIFARIKKAL